VHVEAVTDITTFTNFL